MATEPKAPTPLPDGRGPQHAPQGQRTSLLPQALTAVCFAYFVNATTGLMGGRSALVWVAIVAGGGLGIGLLWQYVLTPYRLQVLAGKLRARVGRLRGVPAPPVSVPSLPDGGPASAEPEGTSVVWRRIVQVLAGMAVLTLLLAFALLQLSLVVMLVTIVILLIVIGPTLFPPGRISARLEPAMSSIASSTACIALTLGSLAVANGVQNPGALAGTWQAGSWVYVQDDQRFPALPDKLRWDLAIKGGCLGQRCTYEARPRDLKDQTILGPVVLTPGADGGYRGRRAYVADCVEADNPNNIVVDSGYNGSDVYRLEPGPYVGPPERQQPTSVRIEITHIATPTVAAKAKNCPDILEVTRTTAERI